MNPVNSTTTHLVHHLEKTREHKDDPLAQRFVMRLKAVNQNPLITSATLDEECGKLPEPTDEMSDPVRIIPHVLFCLPIGL